MMGIIDGITQRAALQLAPLNKVQEICLPVPPSVNAMYFNLRGKGRRGRAKTRAYELWIEQADALYLTQKRGIVPVTGPCEIAIKLPKCRGDISNRIKAAEDFLVSRGITGDDKHNRKVSIERDESLTCCVVTITPACVPAMRDSQRTE